MAGSGPKLEFEGHEGSWSPSDAAAIGISAEFGFSALVRLKKYLDTIRQAHLPTMGYYVSDPHDGFCHNKSSKNRSSRSSTATCVTSLARAGLWKGASLPIAKNTAAVAERLLERPWRSAGLPEDNPFTLAFIAEGVLDLNDADPGYAGSDEHLDIIDREIVPKLIRATKTTGAVKIEGFPESAYLTQLVYRVLARRGSLRKKLRKRIAAWSRAEVATQISLISAGSRVGDPSQLAYALITSASAHKDEDTSPEQKHILNYGIELFFSTQRADGAWPLSRPLFVYEKTGNAHCFEYELLAQLLTCEPLRNSLLNHLPRLERAALLLERTGFDLEPTRPGQVVAWASGHHPHLAGPESWSTASVYFFAYALDRLVAEAMRRVVFNEIGALYTPPRTVVATSQTVGAFASNLLDSTVKNPENGREESLKEILAKRFVFPIADQAGDVARGQKLSKDTPMSAILFGPPGTSKTELANIIARYLNWPLLSIDPSYLVQEGLDKVQAMANRLFSMLALAEQVVVLLDEFDEMGRDRSRTDELYSRFITTAMLPKLIEINKQRKIVFLLATNYVSGFDAAFSRGGRFDMLVQVMPPSFDEKWRVWKKDLQALYDHYNTSQQLPDFKKWIASLTYAETDVLVHALRQDQSLVNQVQLLSGAYAGCTMKKTNIVDGRTIDWETTSLEDAKLMRLPMLRWRDEPMLPRLIE